MSASENWRELVAQISGDSAPADSPDLARLYRLACDEARHALRTFHAGIRAQVEDLVHDRLFDELDAILAADNPRAYFITMIRNAALDLQRRDRRLVYDDTQAPEQEPPRAGGVEEVVFARAEVERLMPLLNPREREIFSAIAAGEDRDDIAVVLGTSRANVDQIVSRARKRLAGAP